MDDLPTYPPTTQFSEREKSFFKSPELRMPSMIGYMFYLSRFARDKTAMCLSRPAHAPSDLS